MRQATQESLPRPHNLDIEQQLLGELLMDNGAVEPLAAFLMPEHFAEPLHGRLYKAISNAVKSGHLASPFTLKNELETDEALKSIGGMQYIATLCGCARDCLDAVGWGKQIHSMAFRRRLVATAHDILDAAQEASIEFTPERIADYAENLLTAATAEASPNAVDRFRDLGSITSGVLRAIDGGKSEPSVPFGLRAIDEATGGMRAGELIIIGARPGMGKTAVACHIAQYAARQGVGVGFFSMEMSASAITLRILTSLAFDRSRTVFENPAYEAARKGKLSDGQKAELFALEGMMQKIPLRIHEGRGLTPGGIVLAAKRLANELQSSGTPLGLIIVDHLQKVKPDRHLNGNKVGEMTEISDALQKMAGTLKVAVVALSQLNRQSEKRDDRRPELGDLRESGSIEQDADMVLLLYREAYYHSKKEPDKASDGHMDWFNTWDKIKHRLDIQIAKQRNGPEGRHEVYFDAPSSALGDL